MITLEPKPRCRLLLVEVPEGAEEFETRHNQLWYCVDNDPDGVMLPVGQYEFIATTDTLTEEQAATLVERGDKGYPDYNPYNDRMYVDSAVVSIRTAVDQSGAQPTRTYAILKEI